MKFTLGKEERLKSRKIIDRLYTQGTAIKVFPLRMVYLETEHTSEFPVQMGVSVPKRKFKKAVDRNRIKRLIREAYRLNKYIVYSNVNRPCVFMISYIGKEEWNYQDIEVKLVKLLEKFIQNHNDEI